MKLGKDPFKVMELFKVGFENLFTERKYKTLHKDKGGTIGGVSSFSRNIDLLRSCSSHEERSKLIELCLELSAPGYKREDGPFRKNFILIFIQRIYRLGRPSTKLPVATTWKTLSVIA